MYHLAQTLSGLLSYSAILFFFSNNGLALRTTEWHTAMDKSPFDRPMEADSSVPFDSRHKQSSSARAQSQHG